MSTKMWPPTQHTARRACLQPPGSTRTKCNSSSRASVSARSGSAGSWFSFNRRSERPATARSSGSTCWPSNISNARRFHTTNALKSGTSVTGFPRKFTARRAVRGFKYRMSSVCAMLLRVIFRTRSSVRALIEGGMLRILFALTLSMRRRVSVSKPSNCGVVTHTHWGKRDEHGATAMAKRRKQHADIHDECCSP